MALDRAIGRDRISRITFLLACFLYGDEEDNSKAEIGFWRLLLGYHVLDVDPAAAEVSEFFRTFRVKLQKLLHKPLLEFSNGVH